MPAASIYMYTHRSSKINKTINIGIRDPTTFEMGGYEYIPASSSQALICLCLIPHGYVRWWL